MTGADRSREFGWLRAFFWPVHSHELRKLVPMLCMFFLLTLDYNVLRCLKDTLVITAKNSGAEVIPFIKVWAMFPTSVLLTWVFIRLSNRFRRETVFYTMLSGFLLFFLMFAVYLYPRREQMHLHQIADSLALLLPPGCKGMILMVRYWSFSIFYVMAELWGNIVMFLLFWGFANQVTKLEEAKRFYGLFGVAINLSGIAAGQLSIFMTNLVQEVTNCASEAVLWDKSLLLLLLIVVGSGSIALVLFSRLNSILGKHPELMRGSVAENKVVTKLSMRENIRYLLSSRYVICLVAIIVAYNIVINLVEVMWKHCVLEMYPNPISYNLFMNRVTTWIGIVATLSSLFVSGNSLRLFGWTATAMITPIVLLVTSVGFFGAFFLRESFGLGLPLLGWVVFFGTLQNCCSRAAKYAVFDATKEMAFVPLSRDEQIKAKAAVDGICNRLGKSGGSVIYQFLLFFLTTISASAPYIAVILFIIIGGWMAAVRMLGSQFTELATKGRVHDLTTAQTASV